MTDCSVTGSKKLYYNEGTFKTMKKIKVIKIRNEETFCSILEDYVSNANVNIIGSGINTDKKAHLYWAIILIDEEPIDRIKT